MLEQHFRGGLQGTEKSVNWFASAASKAAERALDSLDPWVVGRCEWLPVCVCVGGNALAPYLKAHACPGSSPTLVPGLPSSVSTPGPAAGSQGDQLLAVIRSSSGLGRPGRLCNPRVMQRGAGGACGVGGGGGGGPPGPPCTSGAIGSARLSSPRFCSHSCVHSARDPPSDP